MRLLQLFKKSINLFLHPLRLVELYKAKKLLKRYKTLFYANNPLRYFEMRAVCLSREDPVEFFDHYTVFSYWVAEFVNGLNNGKRVLDVGGKKLLNAILSLNNEVTSVVLADCGDKISKVRYVIHDISNKLPFPDNYFDIFTSPGTLHLCGLGRYGDILNPNALVDFIKELDRVMKKENSHLFLILPLGRNHLLFNLHFIFDFNTIINLFSGWHLEDYFVDEFVHFGKREEQKPKERFSKNISTNDFKLGEYKIVYLHFRR